MSACAAERKAEQMTDYDAIVIGAGHNGLAAAVLLQKAGLRTLCLESKLYAGGMASTVELFDGYRFEIAGSVQFPTAPVVREALGLDTIPTIDLDVMSVALRGVGDDPMVQYSDPIKLFTHLNEVHGADAVNGMAGLMGWAMAPTRALGRFDAGAPPKTLDEMYACATNEFERSAIDDMLFGSVTDVLDRYLPDREKHGALRGSMTVLAVNTLYRGPATPGSAAALAFGLGVPDGDIMQMKKLRGGIGALTEHLVEVLEREGGEVRLRTKSTTEVDNNFGDALGDAAPDRNARCHIGILVALAEPRAQATLGALAIVIDRQVDALGDRELRGVVLRFFEETTQQRALRDEVGGGRRARAHPSVAMANGALECDLVARAEPDRRMRLLNRLGLHREVFEFPELAGE